MATVKAPVIDCFPFFNELDLLEIRLNSLAPYVDRFILVESEETHSGKRKPLFFYENQDRFRDFPITRLVSVPCPTVKKGDVSGNAWRREHYQREYLRGAIEHFDDDCIILLSDLDEIPDLENWDGERFGVFKVATYYYYLNLRAVGNDMRCTTVEKRKYITTMNRLIHKRSIFPIVGTGWHFSTLGTAEEIKYKFESFAHTELDNPEFLNQIGDKRKNLSDPFKGAAPNWGDRKFELKKEVLTGPKWLVENIHRYPHLLCS